MMTSSLFIFVLPPANPINTPVWMNALLEKLRRYKWSYALYNYFQKDQLLHNEALYRHYGIDKRYYHSVSMEDFRHLLEEQALEGGPAEAHSRERLPSDPLFKSLTPAYQETLLDWSDHGFAILPGFFSPQQVDTFNQEAARVKAEGKAQRGHQDKIMFAIHHSEALYGAGTHPLLLQILELLLGREVELFQSLNFVRGTQQRAHSDFIHMTTFPPGQLIAAWVALEDIHPDSGPLHYYRGSHKLPYVLNRDIGNVGTRTRLGPKVYADYEDHIEGMIQQHGLQKEIFLPRKGDVFIWHANLLHGAEPIADPQRTRQSMVFHYFAKGAICFHEISQRPALKRASSTEQAPGSR